MLTKRYKYIYLFGTLLTACLAEDDLIKLDCPIGQERACGLEDHFVEGATVVGECKRGYQICIRSGWTDCRNVISPTSEVCDGRDNNCNGEIDETYPELGELCGIREGISYGVGICTPGVSICQDGYLRCEGHIGKQEEECNGLDDDCNGVIDDNIPNVTALVCYDGPPETMFIGECQPGIQHCDAGDFGGCTRQVLPSPEMCDGLDNDCDGEIDEGFDNTKVDLVFIVDISGSFDVEIERVINGIIPLLEEDITNNFRFALVLIGTHDRMSTPEFRGREHLLTMRLSTDLVTGEEFLPFLESAYILANTRNSGGDEPSYDAIISTSENIWELSFRPESNRVIVLLTDEEGQSLYGPAITKEEVTNSTISNNFIVHVFNESRYYLDFDTIVRNPANFHTLESNPDAPSVFTSLRNIFLNICPPAP